MSDITGHWSVYPIKNQGRDLFIFFISQMTEDITLPKIVSFLRVGKRRLEIFNKACIKFGLTIVDYTTKNNFILIDDELDFISANKILKNSLSATLTPIFIRTQWLSDSIKQNQLLSHQSYILHATSSSITKTLNTPIKIEIITEQLPIKRERTISSSASDTDDESSSKKVFFRKKFFEKFFFY